MMRRRRFENVFDLRDRDTKVVYKGSKLKVNKPDVATYMDG
jgi:hypothetical protein